MLDAGGLDRINTLPKLLDYLRENCDWPIEEENFEDLVFDWDPKELGLKDAEEYREIEIKQLRPLTSNQPWGIFFVNFPKKDLKVTVLRRILGALTVKCRKSANAGERAAWQRHDLLFLSAYGDGGHRRLTFAHFQDDPDDPRGIARLDVLGWNPDNTIRRLSEVRDRLTSKLRWPLNGEGTEAWRKRWSDAFDERPRETISTSKDLASSMATLARGIRDRAVSLLDEESDNGPLTKLYKAFKEALIHDLTPQRFADMYAQTITYGLLATTFRRPSGAVTADSISMMALPTNPFLADTLKDFLQAGGRKGGMDFDELGINDVVEMLRRANMEAVLRDFDDRNPEEDPVIHFYESFLKEYDPQERIQRGVFYTPRPIVSFIVRSVDEVLRHDFKLEDGLADISTWAEMEKRLPGLKRPIGVDADEPFVRILDPATGTGTFLVEVIEVIHSRMTGKWEAAGKSKKEIDGLWNHYVPRHLLPRLHAFELMMAPYAIAHMKIGLKLFDTGYKFDSSERARIFLTNALEDAKDFDAEFEFMSAALAKEAREVNEVKRRLRFTVIIGNPPYSVSSWNTGAWITSLIEVYKTTVRGEESQIQALSNDYIKFLGFGQWQLERSGVGVQSMITGHGYLSGTQPRDMRRKFTEVFEKSYYVDLHGSIRKSGPASALDEPVFQIMTGVAIMLGIDLGNNKAGQAGCISITGPISKKFAFLNGTSFLDTFSKVPLYRPIAPHFQFSAPQTSQDIADEYVRFIEVPEIFGSGNRAADKEVFWATGFASQQDELAISFTQEDLDKKMRALGDSDSFEQLQEHYRICTTDQWNYEEAKRYVLGATWRKDIRQVSYRPFDERWTVFDKRVLTILRNRVMTQLTDPADGNLALITSRAVNDLLFAHCFVTARPTDKIFISSKTSTNAYVFPLYFHRTDLLGSRLSHNLSQKFLTRLAHVLGLPQDPKTGNLPTGLTARHIVGYIYAVLNSPTYRVRYGEFLKIEFPRIPLPGAGEVFRKLVAVGEKLIALHLLDQKNDKSLEDPKAVRLAGRGAALVEKGAPKWNNGRVAINAERWFEEVPENVWLFQIGGYQVCEKWLKDRRIDKLDRALNESEVLHYRRIVTAVSETIDLMAEIDRVIEHHGGWPDAFRGMTKQTKEG